jgi:hypothetical protein
LQLPLKLPVLSRHRHLHLASALLQQQPELLTQLPLFWPAVELVGSTAEGQTPKTRNFQIQFNQLVRFSNG